MNVTRRLYPLLALLLLALAFVALVALNSVALRGVRLDLTRNGLHTLSPGTVAILSELEEPVRLRLYYSEQQTRDRGELQTFRVYATRVREMLEEIAARSGGRLTFEVVDPEPFSEAEDQAAAYGLSSLQLNTAGDRLYFGLVGSNSVDREEIIPFIQPGRETLLEYDIARLIAGLGRDERPVVAMLSGLPTGPQAEPGGPATAGWVFDRHLREMFELRRLQGQPTSIADDVDLLLLVHPKGLNEDTQYAIDQYVLRGGKLLAFVDPDAESDPAAFDPLMQVAVTIPRASDLPQLFAGWGIRFDPGQIVLDDRYALQVEDSERRPVRHLAVIGLDEAGMNPDDVVTADIGSLNFSSAGALELAPDSPLQMEPLVQSSTAAALAPVAKVRESAANPGALRTGFHASGNPYVLAARFSGPARSAFPQRAGAGHLAEATAPVNIVVVADTDVLTNRLWVTVSQFLGQEVVNTPFADNGAFIYNAVDNLVGDAHLISVRARQPATRRFEVVESLRRNAEERYRSTEEQLQRQLGEIEQQLIALQQPGEQAQAMTPAQAEQLVRFQEERLRMRRELREVQRRLNADIDGLGTRLTRINVLGMPALVVLVSLFVAWRRWWRRRGAAA
ncbi:GldG family protein [Arenimonas composti]|uniref:Uncharacterized protein n=1 Tax=Arenimonas composti TR7-09 = DSM 18010 TaxID=1121013 RepID=A0A091BZD4_9GAMM|nr:Gldg family protein [Arenimonas composti]KFN49730.1 hypothetical protein P873_09235 [Arenimonas composti TR7-09 = DSM 18010]